MKGPAVTVLMSFWVSTSFIALAILARLENALYLPQAFRFLLGAVVLGGLTLAVLKRPPRISLRLFHAALTVGALMYFFAPLLTLFALRSLPSGFVGAILATTPFFFVWIAYGGSENRLPMLLLLIPALVAYFFGVVEVASLRGGMIPALGCAFAAMLCNVAGIWVSKRLFWLHSTLDLSFWSMAFAGLAFLITGLVSSESRMLSEWSHAYLAVLVFLGVVITGMGTYFFRSGIDGFSPAIHTVVTVLGPTAIGFALWGETPLNPWTLVGCLALTGILAWVAHWEFPQRWMGVHLKSVTRDGDRLHCVVAGSLNHSGTTSATQLVTLSMGGVGIRLVAPVTAQENVELEIPIPGGASCVTVEGRIAYVMESDSKEFPWEAGMEFSRISADRKQSLVEFLARLTRAQE